MISLIREKGILLRKFKCWAWVGYVGTRLLPFFWYYVKFLQGCLKEAAMGKLQWGLVPNNRGWSTRAGVNKIGCNVLQYIQDHFDSPGVKMVFFCVIRHTWLYTYSVWRAGWSGKLPGSNSEMWLYPRSSVRSRGSLFRASCLMCVISLWCLKKQVYVHHYYKKNPCDFEEDVNFCMADHFVAHHGHMEMLNIANHLVEKTEQIM